MIRLSISTQMSSDLNGFWHLTVRLSRIPTLRPPLGLEEGGLLPLMTSPTDKCSAESVLVVFLPMPLYGPSCPPSSLRSPSKGQ